MRWLLALPVLMLALAGTAEAHDVAGHATGFAAGLVHPLGGLDHVLAMVAIGLWAAQLGGRAGWLVPSCFVAAMALGGAAGMLCPGVPFVELGIALSVVTLGAMLALGSRLPLAAAAALAGAFALFHGHAHGSEISESASAMLYGGGFIAATALLHGIGLALGAALRSHTALRVGGAAIAAAGMLLLVA